MIILSLLLTTAGLFHDPEGVPNGKYKTLQC